MIIGGGTQIFWSIYYLYDVAGLVLVLYIQQHFDLSTFTFKRRTRDMLLILVISVVTLSHTYILEADIYLKTHLHW